MSEVVKVTKENRQGEELGSFEMELPTSFEELRTLPGEMKALAYVRNQMKIEARAKNFPGEAKSKAVISKSALSTLRSGIKGGEFSEEDLLEFIKAKRGQA